MKACRTCSEGKDPTQFRPSRPDCRACERAAAREYGASNRAKRNARLSRWRKMNPDKAAANDRRKHLRANYGLTEQDVEDMRIAQGGRCLLCPTEGALVIDTATRPGAFAAFSARPATMPSVMSRRATAGYVAPPYISTPHAMRTCCWNWRTHHPWHLLMLI